MSYAYFDLGKKLPQPTKIKFPEIRKRLLELAAADQAARKRLSKKASKRQLNGLGKEDEKRTQEMLALLSVCGPSAKNIGLDGSRAVWVLAIHARLPVIKKVLRSFQSLYKLGEKNVFYWGIPFLIDRIRIEEGKKQLYGTQYHFDKNNVLGNFPISNPGMVNKRRAAYDLPPIEGELDELKKRY